MFVIVITEQIYVYKNEHLLKKAYHKTHTQLFCYSVFNKKCPILHLIKYPKEIYFSDCKDWQNT